MSLLRFSIIVIALMIMAVQSCIPPVNDIPQNPQKLSPSSVDMLDVSRAIPFFQDYLRAMDRTELIDLLSEEGPYTIFMPNQNAFAKLRTDFMVDDLDELPEELVRRILLYHIINGRWYLSAFDNDYYPTLLTEATTGNPVDLYVENTTILRLNGNFLIDEPDLSSTNGIIHSIDAVLELPSVVMHLGTNPDFSSFYNIISDNYVDPSIIDALIDSRTYTLLVPSNEAFERFFAENESWNSIDDIPATTLGSIVENHIITDINFLLKSADSEQTLTTKSQDQLTFIPDGKNWFFVDQYGKKAQVTLNDIQAVNGVIHQIDRVLLPE